MTQQSRRPTLTLIVLAAGILAACEHATPPVAPSDTPPGPGILAGPSAGSHATDSNSGKDCAFGFRVTFDDTTANKLRSDGRAYVDGSEHVMAATGNGPGFRLDTNSSQKLEGAAGTRTLVIDFNGVAAPPAPFPSANRGIDLRFYLGDGVGLDLCSLALGSSASVGLAVTFSALEKTDDPRTLTYGVPQTQNGGPLIGDRVLVTRTGTSTWTIAGQTAGLRAGYQYDPVVVGASRLTMPFTMYLVRI